MHVYHLITDPMAQAKLVACRGYLVYLAARPAYFYESVGTLKCPGRPDHAINKVICWFVYVDLLHCVLDRHICLYII